MIIKSEINTRHGRMVIHHPNDYISQHLLNRGEYEWYVIEIIANLIRNSESGIVLDIGANMGTVCLPLARNFPNHTIHAFEVQPHMLDILQENISLNQLSNITVHPYGLAERSYRTHTNVPDYDSADNIGAFSLDETVKKHSQYNHVTGSTVEIELRQLDELELQSVVCVKLDVEGLELPILQGAVNTLEANNFPPIVYEMWAYNPWWHQQSQQLRNFLTNLGYTINHRDDTAVAVKK